MGPDTSASDERAIRVRRYLLRNPAIAVTLLYLLTTSIGVTFALLHFRAFGIAIFDFWQLSDLLIAGFREPASFAHALVVTSAVVWMYRDTQGRDREYLRKADEIEARYRAGERGWLFEHRLKAYRRNSAFMRESLAPSGGGPLVRLNRWGRENGWLVFCALGIFYFVSVINAHVGMRKLRPDAWFPAAAVRLLPAGGEIGDPRLDPQLLVGMTNGHMFLLSRNSGEVTVVPLTSVISLRTSPARASWRQRLGIG